MNANLTYRRFLKFLSITRIQFIYKLLFFCNTLVDWCGQWNMTLDVNKIHEELP